MSPLSRYHFQGQHANETVLRIIHRHWFNIVMQYIILAILAFIVLAIFTLLPVLLPTVTTGFPQTLLLFVQNTLLLFMWIYAFLVWVDYYFDIWIITNERIVNIEQKGLFNRSVSELQFSRIQDVTTVVDGLIQTVLNFGNVYVQTAAETERFLFRQVPDPYAIKDMVMQLSRSSTEADFVRLSETLRVGKRVA